MKKYKVAVVGAGAVGIEMIRILDQRKFPADEVRVLARSARTLEVEGKKYQVRETTPEAFDGIEIALFAGTEGEKGAAVTFGKEAIRRGAVVIDNGADYRMDPNVPLVIPEVNGDALQNHHGIIANPNCTTATLMLAFGPLHKAFKVKRVVVSTYQAVSGAGGKAIEALKQQAKLSLEGKKIEDLGGFPNQIAFNLLANNWKIEEKGYSNEEWKVVKETHKILGDDSIKVHVTTVRVPTYVAHGESVWIQTEKPITVEKAREVLTKAPGVRIVDSANPYEGADCPMPLTAAGHDESFVGRLRQDLFDENAFSFWVVGDNLRKGAALNAVQIAEHLVQKEWLKGAAQTATAAR